MSSESFGKVAVLFGGSSAERAISIKSGEAVSKALRNVGLDVLDFDPSDSTLNELKNLEVDRVLIMLHGRGGEDGSIQGALQFLGLPYTGSGVLGSALAMDKIRSKGIFKSVGLPTAKYEVVSQADLPKLDVEALMADFEQQIMVKPSHEGSSIGMTRVKEADQLKAAIETALEFDSEVLLEKFITGKEFTVSVLNGEALPSIQMETPRSFYDYEAKYHTSTTRYHCPSGLDKETEDRLAEISLKAFSAVGASGWGRVDLMQDENGDFFILEVNTVPGMTEKSLVPMAAKVAGISFEELVLAVLKSSEIRR